MDVVRPQPGPDPGLGCLPGLLLALLAGPLLLGAAAVGAAALLSRTIGGSDGGTWAALLGLAALALLAAAARVGRAVLRRAGPRVVSGAARGRRSRAGSPRCARSPRR